MQLNNSRQFRFTVRKPNKASGQRSSSEKSCSCGRHPMASRHSRHSLVLQQLVLLAQLAQLGAHGALVAAHGADLTAQVLLHLAAGLQVCLQLLDVLLQPETQRGKHDDETNQWQNNPRWCYETRQHLFPKERSHRADCQVGLLLLAPVQHWRTKRAPPNDLMPPPTPQIRRIKSLRATK